MIYPSTTQNRLEDVQSLLAFLHCAPLSDPLVWRAAIGAPAAAGHPAALARLRLGVRAVCLRRSKAALSGLLPPKSVEVRRVNMTGPAREAYDALFK